MKLALARAGLWFFGTIIVVGFFGNEAFNDSSNTTAVKILVVIGSLFGAAAFFYTLCENFAQERKLQMQERMANIERMTKDTPTSRSGTDNAS